MRRMELPGISDTVWQLIHFIQHHLFGALFVPPDLKGAEKGHLRLKALPETENRVREALRPA